MTVEQQVNVVNTGTSEQFDFFLFLSKEEAEKLGLPERVSIKFPSNILAKAFAETLGARCYRTNNHLRPMWIQLI